MRATHHVCCSLSTFIESTPTQNAFMTLLNGQSITINLIGSMFLPPNLILNNVLFVPNFHLNLLQTSSLT